jgi:hypothetical protein
LQKEVQNILLKFIQNNDYYDRVVLHGFSVAGYVWGECMVHMKRDLEKYVDLLGRIKGQIWDSATFWAETPVGVANAIYPDNKLLQSLLKSYLDFHLKVFEKVATRYYRAAEEAQMETVVKSPAVFFFSKKDLISLESRNLWTINHWKEMGMSVDWKCFQSSPHVRHYNYYKDEYVKTVEDLLKNINLAKKS